MARRLGPARPARTARARSASRVQRQSRAGRQLSTAQARARRASRVRDRGGTAHRSGSPRPAPAARRRGRARPGASPQPASACWTSAGRQAAAGSPSDLSHAAVGGEHHQRAAVVSLDEAGTYDLGEHRRYPGAAQLRRCSPMGRGGHRRRPFTSRARAPSPSPRRHRGRHVRGAGRPLALRLHGTGGRFPRCNRPPCAAAPAGAGTPAARSGPAVPIASCSSSSVRAVRSDSSTSASISSASRRYSSLCGVPSVTCRAEERWREGRSARISGQRSEQRRARVGCAARARPAGCRSGPGAAAVRSSGPPPPAEHRAAACAARAAPAPSSVVRSASGAGSRCSATADAPVRGGGRGCRSVVLAPSRRGRPAGHRAYGRRRLRSWMLSPSSCYCRMATRAAVCTYRVYASCHCAVLPRSDLAPIRTMRTDRRAHGMMAAMRAVVQRVDGASVVVDGRDGRGDRRRGTVRAGRGHARGHQGEGGPARPQALVGPDPGGREVLLGHGRAAARDQPVHALRRRPQGPPPHLERRRTRRRSPSRWSTRSSRSCARWAPRWRRAASARRCGSR